MVPIHPWEEEEEEWVWGLAVDLVVSGQEEEAAEGALEEVRLWRN